MVSTLDEKRSIQRHNTEISEWWDWGGGTQDYESMASDLSVTTPEA